MKRLLLAVVGLGLFQLSAGGISQVQGLKVEKNCIVAHRPIRTVELDFFRADIDWEIHNYQNHIKFERKKQFGSEVMMLTNREQKDCWKYKYWTAFELRTGPIKVKNPRFYHIKYATAANFSTAGFKGKHGRHFNRLEFYDRFGKLLELRPFRYVSESQKLTEHILNGEFPRGTRTFFMIFGGDIALNPGRFVAYADVKIKIAENSSTWSRQSSFESQVFPIQPGKNNLSWQIQGAGAKAKFQIATAPALHGLPGKFTAFYGPDGTSKSYFTTPNSTLPAFPPNAKFFRYRAVLNSSSQAPAVLRQVNIAGHQDRNWQQDYDFQVPQIVRTSASPTLQARQNFVFAINDASGADFSTLEVTLDGKKVTPFAVPQGVAVPPPNGQFTPGVHRVNIAVNDWNGNRAKKTLYFCIGKPRTTNIVTLRDDGQVLIDGKPFFPLGFYTAQLDEPSFEVNFAKLQKAGINLLQSYALSNYPHTRKFMELCAQKGIKVWLAATGATNNGTQEDIVRRLGEFIDNPALVAWYIGDDTYDHNTPEQLQERTELVQAIAPHLLTVQADTVAIGFSDLPINRYRPYAATTKIFMPEIYPIGENGNRNDGAYCVAKVIDSMEKCNQVIREEKLAPRAIWAIIQYFQQGSRWCRYPTPTELRAMNFAAIIKGAKGLTWFMYKDYPGGIIKGAASSPEKWAEFSKISQELAALLPIFAERDAAQQLAVKVTSGPQKLTFKNRPYASVITLTKKHEGKTYLFALNTTLKNLRGELTVPGYQSARLWSTPQTLNINNHKINLTFGPFEVKIIELK